GQLPHPERHAIPARHARRVAASGQRKMARVLAAQRSGIGAARMAEKHVVYAPMQRRARPAGDLRAPQTEVPPLERELESIDLCIRLFKTDYQPVLIAPKVTLAKNPARLPKGTGNRKALEILRETGVPLTATELAYLVLERIGKEPSEPAISMLAKAIHSSFKRQRNPVVAYDRSTWPGKWRLLPPSHAFSGGKRRSSS